MTHRHLTELEKVPAAWHNAVAGHLAGGNPTAGIYIGNKAVPDLDDLGHLAGHPMPTWGPGHTWDEVPGCYDWPARVLALGGGNATHGSQSLALHEFGHVADDTAGRATGTGDRASHSDAWIRLHRPIAAAPDQDDYYLGLYGSGLSEAWAECFACWARDRPAARPADGIAAHFRIGTREAAAIVAYFDNIETRLARRRR
ncbi:hypothetical protein [Actinoplanes rectilineatus]|uniref:hypothetical protein n=1 Tax=Actinoplanes rectilineatus TaxID=113571 RepID=UPI0005F2F013|nr:hypothetical protein [Actinoplanes rectilineatus]